MVLAGFVGGCRWFWVVLGGFGWFWLVPCFSNYDKENYIKLNVLFFSFFLWRQR